MHIAFVLVLHSQEYSTLSKIKHQSESLFDVVALIHKQTNIASTEKYKRVRETVCSSDECVFECQLKRSELHLEELISLSMITWISSLRLRRIICPEFWCNQNSLRVAIGIMRSRRALTIPDLHVHTKEIHGAVQLLSRMMLIFGPPVSFSLSCLNARVAVWHRGIVAL